jgi:hypothetical protein
VEGGLEIDSRVAPADSQVRSARNLMGPGAVADRRLVELLMTGSLAAAGGLPVWLAKHVRKHETTAVRWSLKNRATSNFEMKIHFAI